MHDGTFAAAVAMGAAAAVEQAGQGDAGQGFACVWVTTQQQPQHAVPRNALAAALQRSP
jgi:hypothetical protein